MKTIPKIINYLLDIILPKNCIGCNSQRCFLCDDCFSLIEINPYRYCLCNSLQKISNENSCMNCKDRCLDRIYSASDYENRIVKKMIQEVKYRFQIKELCIPLAAIILMHLKITDFKFKDDMIFIPVPLHKSNERLRGFNQSKEIVKIITEEIDIPYSFDNLIKIKRTKDQNKLLEKERINNLKGCFSVIKPEIVKDKTILLLDDIYTTGTTMEECAKALKMNGAKYVYGITACREILP